MEVDSNDYIAEPERTMTESLDWFKQKFIKKATFKQKFAVF